MTSNRDEWGAAAEHWARAAEQEEVGASAEAARWMLRAADLQAGERVLEVAGGAGRVGLQAASAVGPEGSVLCSDFSEQMVRVARERFERLGISNVETRALDAQSLDLDAEAFDAVLCRFGYMLMPDPLQALRESARVLRPAGRLVLAVWGEAEQNPWLSNLLDAVMSHLSAPPPEPGAPGPFSLGDPVRLREMLAGAGFAEVEVEEIETEQVYESLDGWWEKLLGVGGPLKAVLDPLPDTELNAIRDAALASVEEFVTDDGSVVVPATVVAARARKGP
ncbi:MAG TPA: methyltransferase domain-containing protein [Solirubrobacterales bacterium]|nr:methyltransferase domain-containing protein [Solirubrobacterales bacterium]